MSSTEPGINAQIWQVVHAIPAGSVSTYGDIAARAGMIGAARRVGAALKGLPADTQIPWHRVLNASGGISLPSNSSSAQLQRDRLEAEGVEFKLNGKVDLKRFRWH